MALRATYFLTVIYGDPVALTVFRQSITMLARKMSATAEQHGLLQSDYLEEVAAQVSH